MKKLQHSLAACLVGLSLAGASMAADVTAVVGWSQRVELGPLASGVIETVHVRPGQSVAKGDPLVRLDQRGFTSRVAQTQAEYRHAQAVLEEAKREDERAVELYDRTLLSDFERNLAAIALEAARARLEAARSALVHARLDLEHSLVSAPFDGIVLAVNAAPGQTVISELQSQPLVTLADNRVYRARAQVDGALAGRLEPGRTLRATVRGEELEALVSYVGFEPVGSSAAGPSYELIADIDAGGRKLRVGESVILHLD